MPRRASAGLLLYRLNEGNVLEVLIVHMGGPFWAARDAHAWSIPKGEHADDETAFDAARREFEEELGSLISVEDFIGLGEIEQPSGKVVTIFAVEGDFDAASATSNTFEMEWPKGSGTISSYPEVDKAEWFDTSTAREKLLEGQAGFLDRLIIALQDLGVDVQERCAAPAAARPPVTATSPVTRSASGGRPRPRLPRQPAR
jgi:predicted NUDIX family NTP pyrophosphohydrolase